jgi:hypothetical protein
MRHTLLADRREIQTAPPRGGRFGSGNHHPFPQGGRSTPGQRKITGHPSGGCSQTRRFKGPAEPRCSPRLHHGGGPQALRGPGGHARFRRRGHNAVVPTSPPRHGQVAPSDARKRAPRATPPGPLVPPKRHPVRHAAGSFHTVAHRALSSASIHSPAGSKRLRRWKWRAATVAPVTAIGPASKFRPDRCRQLSRPLRSDGPPSSRRRARWAAPTTLFPPISFPPLEPPFPDPPFKLEHAKGGKPQGATARRL